ncbi:MAG: hypothetical protein II909_03360 [Kiritimatiellae bacterium]|nr:hypothetical protein [Kiritimatiellia bacterium]
MRTLCGTILAAAIVFDCAAAIPSPREIRGPFPILSVAYHKDGSVDYDTIVEEARYVDACGCPGVIWGQSDDAVDFLTLREKEQSYEALAKGMQGRNIVLVFGCNGATADEMLACVDAAQKAADRYPAAKIALSARPPDDTRTLEDLERAWRRLGETARRPCILQTFTPGKTPTPSVDLLVRLAVDYPDVFGYVKEESGGREVNDRIAMLNAAKPAIKNVFAARGGWSWLFQARQFGAEGLISERCGLAPLLAKIWREMEKGEKADQTRLTMGYALYRLMIDQRDFDDEPIKLRGYRLYFLQKAGVFKNRTSRIPVHPPGVVSKKWRLEEDVPLTDAQKRELDALYDAMMAF